LNADEHDETYGARDVTVDGFEHPSVNVYDGGI
jgi:hypothetical protein